MNIKPFSEKKVNVKKKTSNISVDSARLADYLM